jgi:hypothetical protein
MAIAQHTAREALAKQTEFTNRLFSNRFPPKVRNGLMRQAADDSLPYRHAPVVSDSLEL